MSAHPDDVTLDAYAEDLLDPAARAHIDTHLAECDDCRSEVERQRSLLASLRALPSEVLPAADLRPDIRRALGRRADGDERRRVLRSMRTPLAAAAVLLVAIGAGAAVLLLSTGDPVERVALDYTRAAVTPATFERTRADHVRTANELSLLLDRHRRQLSPETIVLVERSLDTIEQALREADAALREDPASPLVRDLILATEAKRVETLRWAASLGST